MHKSCVVQVAAIRLSILSPKVHKYGPYDVDYEVTRGGWT